jgi:hypothetical protein
MAVKTFTTGEVLTAADTNTYLNNGGLVYVTSQTIGSGVSSVTVSNCFSSTYDSYKVIISGGAASGTSYLGLCMATSGGADTSSVYQQSFLYTTFANTPLAVGNTFTSASYTGSVNANGVAAMIELVSPYQAANTFLTAFGGARGSFMGWSTVLVNTTTQYTGFLVFPNAGTITGGTITVYGYRKA